MTTNGERIKSSAAWCHATRNPVTNRLIAPCGKNTALYAVIGGCTVGDLSLQFRRSRKMDNFPGIFSLFSGRFEDPEITLPDPRDIDAAQLIFNRLSKERLSGRYAAGSPIKVVAYLDSRDLREGLNPTGKHIVLDAYEVRFDPGISDADLVPRYYTGVDWLPLDPERCEGLCQTLYSDAIDLGSADRASKT